MSRPACMLLLLLAPSAASRAHAQQLREEWVGTAPSCGASPSDCTRRGMDYVRSDKSGDGRGCFTGTKVLCRERRSSASSDMIQVWIGTAPACNASPQDCSRSGLTYIRSHSSGDGASCLTGEKVLCQGPRASYRPQAQGIAADVNQVGQAAASAVQTLRGSMEQGAMVVRDGFARYGCAFIRETAGLGGVVPFQLAAQCGVRQAEGALRALNSPQVQRFLSLVRQPLAAAAVGVRQRMPAIQNAVMSGSFEAVIAAAGLGDILAVVAQDRPAGFGGGNPFDSKPATTSRPFISKNSPEGCATQFDAGQANTAAIGWTVIDASLMVGGSYEFGGVYRLPRGERNGRESMLYHSGTFTMGPVSGGVDTGFSFGFSCGLVPTVGMEKSWGVSVGATPGVGGVSFTLWFEGSFSEGKTARMAGISFTLSVVGGSVEMEFARSCTNFQLPGSRSFGALTADCENAGGNVRAPVFDQTGPSVMNVALRKRTAQATTVLDGVSERAVDGNTSGVWSENSVTHSALGPGNWWMVDLGEEYLIQNIHIYNRTDCCPERLNATVAVTATEGWPSNSVAFSVGINGRNGKEAIQVLSRSGSPVYGRYVYVALTQADYLSLAEVEVLGTASAKANAGTRTAATNVALRKRTVQSTTFSDGVSSRAVDGNTSGAWAQASVTHTEGGGGGGNWWMVDLGGEFLITDIYIYNRTDCCSERLGNSVIAVTGAEGFPITATRFQQELGTPRERIHVPLSTFGNVYGRYVYIYKTDGNYLSLAEVEVVGVPR